MYLGRPRVAPNVFGSARLRNACLKLCVNLVYVGASGFDFVFSETGKVKKATYFFLFLLQLKKQQDKNGKRR